MQGHATSASITQIRQLTPSVRELNLEVHDAAMTFEPGQWVDFFIDGVDTVGGYSITSSPATLPNLRLAIKYSKHAPAHWVHSSAAVGDEVNVRPGGSFLWNPGAHPPPLVLVAGGIGITPLLSILETAAELAHRDSAGWTSPRAVQLLYSCSSPEEVLQPGRLGELLHTFKGGLHVQLHLTQTDSTHRAVSGLHDSVSTLEFGRIQASHLQAAVQPGALGGSPPHVFVCGPPAMTDEVVAHMTDMGVASSYLHFERWW